MSFNIQVGALFSLSCTVTHVAQPAASPLSSQRWRESIARRPKFLLGIFYILKSSTPLLMKPRESNSEMDFCCLKTKIYACKMKEKAFTFDNNMQKKNQL